MVLAEAHAVLEEGKQGEVGLEGLCQGHSLVGADVGRGPEVEAVSQELDEVVLGQPDPLVGPHAVVAQVLLAVQAVGAGGVLLVTGAALGVPQAVGPQQAPVGVVEARDATSDHSPVVAVLVVELLLGAHHHVQQVAEQEVGGGQRVHAGLRDGHFLVAGGASELQGVSRASLALQTLSAEGVEAGED